jgi:hypothetical protein
MVVNSNSYIDEFVDNNIHDGKLFFEFKDSVDWEMHLKSRKDFLWKKEDKSDEELLSSNKAYAYCRVAKDEYGSVAKLCMYIEGEVEWDLFERLIRESSFSGIIFKDIEHYFVTIQYVKGYPVSSTLVGRCVYTGIHKLESARDYADYEAIVDYFSIFITKQELVKVIGMANNCLPYCDHIHTSGDIISSFKEKLYGSQSVYNFMFDYIVLEHVVFEYKYGEGHCECIQGKLIDGVFGTLHEPMMDLLDI